MSGKVSDPRSKDASKDPSLSVTKVKAFKDD